VQFELCVASGKSDSGSPILSISDLSRFAVDAAATHLEVISVPDGENGRGLQEQVLDLLAQGDVLTRTQLREVLAVNNERLGKALEALERAERVIRTPRGLQRPR
jgi:hypothetical protein